MKRQRREDCTVRGCTGPLYVFKSSNIFLVLRKICQFHFVTSTFSFLVDPPDIPIVESKSKANLLGYLL